MFDLLFSNTLELDNSRVLSSGEELIRKAPFTIMITFASSVDQDQTAQKCRLAYDLHSFAEIQHTIGSQYIAVISVFLGL